MECIDYQGTIASTGYGVKAVCSRSDGTRRTVRAHRLAYQEANPDEDISDLVIRHTCDRRSCVNPAHLLSGTLADNARDMLERRRHWNQAKTRCKHGHEFDEANTYIDPKSGHRYCRKCRAAYQRELRRRKK